jgi:hypothetical protein
VSGSTAEDRRLCPTRASGAQPLIVHSISIDTCCDRQRRTYHKCFTCAWRGLAAGASLPPEVAAAVQRTTPVVDPAAAAKKPKPDKRGPAPVARPKVSKAV